MIKAFQIHTSKIVAVAFFLSALFSIAAAQTDFIAEAEANLKSPDATTRLTALGTLNSYHRLSFELLVDLIDDSDEKVRGAAVMSLGTLKDKRATDHLLKVLRFDKSGIVKVNASWALGNIGDAESVEPLLKILEAAELGMKFHIIGALGQLDDPRSVRPLFDLKKTDAGHYALKALGKSAVEPMCDILTRGPDVDRWYAITVLERIADERATDALISVLGVRESSIGVSAANAIAWRIGKPAIERLILVLNDRDPSVRENAVLALGQIDDERTTEILISASEDVDLSVRKQAVESLGKQANNRFRPRDQRIVTFLVTAMRDKSPEVRLIALRSLSNVEGDHVYQSLIDALSDPITKAEASLAVGARKDPRAVPYLLDLLRSENPSMAARAQRVLSTLGESSVDGLIAVLADKNKEFPLRETRRRQEQAKVMFRCGTQPTPPALDPRVLAANALGDIGDKRALKPLTEASKDTAEWLRDAARTALQKLSR